MDRKNYEKIKIICVKQGCKYKKSHAEQLFEMIKKNVSYDFDFHCLSESNTNFYGLKGHWSKMVLFQEVKPFLYFDLDIIIQKNIDYLIEEAVGNFLKIIKIEWATEDYARSLNIFPNNKKLWVFNNSSVIKSNGRGLLSIWNHFIQNKKRILNEYYGIDAYLWHEWENYCSYFKEGFFYSFLHGAKFPDKRSMHRPEYNVCLLDGNIMPEDIKWKSKYI